MYLSLTSMILSSLKNTSAQPKLPSSSWIIDSDDSRVTSRGPFSLPECLSLSIRLWPDIGATNEIKKLALFFKPMDLGNRLLSSSMSSSKSA